MARAIEQLANRYGVTPWEMEQAPAKWVYLGLEFIRMEGSVKRGSQK